MTDYKIFLSPPFQNGEEPSAVSQSLNSNWLAPVGPALDKFETELSVIHNNQPILALNSGTAAIHLALKLIGISKGDHVIVASHTHNATVNPIIYEGATPVFVDCDLTTWNLSPDFLEKAIFDLKDRGIQTKAIILVHLYGMPAQLDRLMEIAMENGIPVVEDAAEALGSTFQDQPLGTFGEYGVLSFNGNKIVTTSGGGALITKNNSDRKKALYLATQARDDAPHFQHSAIGYNYRLSNILASLGSAQLSSLNDRVNRRREIFANYINLLKALNQKVGQEVVSWLDENEGSTSNRWLSTFLIKPYNGIDRETWRLKLLENQIESRPLWKPMHLQPVFEQFEFFGAGNADKIFKDGICLPSGNDLTIADQTEVVELLASLYEVN